MSDRIQSVDTLRAVAMFFIVIAHVQPFRGFGEYGNYVFFVLDTVGQFDVPLFFLTSGYFLASSVTAENAVSHVRGSVQKLGSIYLFGTLLYVAGTTVVDLLRGASLTTALVLQRLRNLSVVGVLYYGDEIAVPLWFLTALAFSIGFVAAFVRFEKTRYLLPVAAIAHLVGLVGQNYPQLAAVPVPTRDALFFGFFYVALGYQLGSMDWTPRRDRSRRYLGAVGVLLAAQLGEQYAIGYVLRDHALRQGVFLTEYTVTTIPLVLAVFGYALSNPRLGEGTLLPTVGRYAVGIYLVHVPLLHLLRAMKGVVAPVLGAGMSAMLVWQLVLTPLVYALSLAIYLGLARLDVIELGGSHVPWLARLRSHVRAWLPEGRPAPE